MIPNTIHIQLLHREATAPTQGSSGAAGFDLYSIVDLELPPQEWRAIDTGVALAIPEGYYGKIESRSGLAFREGITAIAGVIDSDYRDAIKVILLNNSFRGFRVRKGDRIGQIVFLKHESPELVVVQELNSTERGTGGFGSTGR